MEIKRGIAASPGIAIAEAYVLDVEDSPVSHRQVAEEDVPLELGRFERAQEAAVEEVRAIQEEAARKASGGYLKIFDFHIELLRDRRITDDIFNTVRQERVTAEYALAKVFKRYTKIFMDNEFLKHRVADLHDIQRHLRRHLSGGAGETNLPRKNNIVVAHDLTPAQTITLEKSYVSGFATDLGGKASHAAIISRALGIPAVVGLQTITADVMAGDRLIVDGERGWVIISPDEATIESYRKQAAALLREKEELAGLRRYPAETRDGFRVRLLANIEFPEEIASAIEGGAEGVGLYRTEYLYAQTGHPPDEQEHYEAYRKAASMLDGQPLTIRTLDLGADKFHAEIGWEKEDNPFLGCRSIRFCLERRDLFRTQLRAILRASNYGNIRILFPMIATLQELRTAKLILDDVKKELRREGVEFREDVPVGIMIEVPSAAWIADLLSRESDFFSIGTNDLIQYCLAVDRANARVASLYQPGHPAVLRLIKHIIEAGRRHNVPVAMCGEMSSELIFTLFLIGAGLREFSVSPGAIPKLKKLIRKIKLSEAKEIARAALALEDADATTEFLAARTREILHQPSP